MQKNKILKKSVLFFGLIAVLILTSCAKQQVKKTTRDEVLENFENFKKLNNFTQKTTLTIDNIVNLDEKNENFFEANITKVLINFIKDAKVKNEIKYDFTDKENQKATISNDVYFKMFNKSAKLYVTKNELIIENDGSSKNLESQNYNEKVEKIRNDAIDNLKAFLVNLDDSNFTKNENIITLQLDKEFLKSDELKMMIKDKLEAGITKIKEEQEKQGEEFDENSYREDLEDLSKFLKTVNDLKVDFILDDSAKIFKSIIVKSSINILLDDPVEKNLQIDFTIESNVEDINETKVEMEEFEDSKDE